MIYNIISRKACLEIITMIMICLLLSTGARGQREDSLSNMRLFMKVCNAYKQLPLQLELEMRNFTNLVTRDEDTSRIHARFFIHENGSYIEFGELEQVANDSLLLLVSNKLKRMILYGHRISMPDQFKKYLGIQLKDSSLMQLAAKYTAYPAPSEKDTSVMEVNSRSLLFHTSLSKESIRVKYNPSNFQLLGIVQTTRSLVPVNREVYNEYVAKEEYKEKLLNVSDSDFFIIREQVSAFEYNRITHQQGDQLPVRVSDRIVGDAAGKYSPAPKYQDFLLTQNF